MKKTRRFVILCSAAVIGFIAVGINSISNYIDKENAYWKQHKKDMALTLENATIDYDSSAEVIGTLVKAEPLKQMKMSQVIVGPNISVDRYHVTQFVVEIPSKKLPTNIFVKDRIWFPKAGFEVSRLSNILPMNLPVICIKNPENEKIHCAMESVPENMVK